MNFLDPAVKPRDDDGDKPRDDEEATHRMTEVDYGMTKACFSWIPRSSRGMTEYKPRMTGASYGMTKACLFWIPRSSRGMTTEVKPRDDGV